MTSFILGPNEFLEYAHDAASRLPATPRYLDSDQLQRLPYFGRIFRQLAKLNQSLNLTSESVGIDASSDPIFFDLRYGAAGAAYYHSVPLMDANPKRELHFITVDLKLIYLALSLCLASPLSRSNDGANASAALFSVKLALATVFRARNSLEGVRVALGLVASAGDPRHGGVFGRKLLDEIQNSKLAEDEVVWILEAIVGYIIFHEWTHFLIAVAPNFDKNSTALLRILEVAVKESMPSLFVQESKVRPGMGCVNAEDLLRAVQIMAKGDKITPFIGLDREEIVCDFNAVIQAVGFIGAKETLEFNHAARLHCIFACTQLGYRSLAAFQPRIQAYLDEVAEISQRGRGGPEGLDLAYVRKLEDATTRSDLHRFRILHIAVDETIIASISERTGRLDKLDDLWREYGRATGQFINKVEEFLGQLSQFLDDDIWSNSGFLALSSRGRAISLIANDGQMPNQSGAHYDPFIMYKFDLGNR